MYAANCPGYIVLNRVQKNCLVYNHIHRGKSLQEYPREEWGGFTQNTLSLEFHKLRENRARWDGAYCHTPERSLVSLRGSWLQIILHALHKQKRKQGGPEYWENPGQRWLTLDLRGWPRGLEEGGFQFCLEAKKSRAWWWMSCVGCRTAT